jgi:hypothetical protein
MGARVLRSGIASIVASRATTSSSCRRSASAESRSSASRPARRRRCAASTNVDVIDAVRIAIRATATIITAAPTRRPVPSVGTLSP